MGDKSRITWEEAKKYIINEVKESRLIRIKGDIEERLFKGDIYVVKREIGG